MKPSIVQPSLSRDFTVLTGVIVFVVVLLSMWITWSTQAEQSKMILEQLEEEALRIDRTLDREISSAGYLLNAMGSQIRALPNPSKRAIAKILQSYQSYSNIYAIWAWTDPKQNIVVSSNRGILDDPVDVSDRDYVQRSLENPWTLHIGAPIEGRVSGRWVLPVSLGVTDDTGKYLGSIAASLSIDGITADLKDLIRRPGISFAVMSEQMIKLTEVSDKEEFVDTYFSDATLKSINFEQSPSGIVSYADLFSMSGIYAHYKLSERLPYILLVGYDATYSQEAITNILLPRIVQIVSVGALALFFLWLIRIQVIRPVVDLTNITADITRGTSFDPEHKKAPMEIEALTMQIHRLSEYIEERKRVEIELREKLDAEMNKQDRTSVDQQKFTEE